MVMNKKDCSGRCRFYKIIKENSPLVNRNLSAFVTGTVSGVNIFLRTVDTPPMVLLHSVRAGYQRSKAKLGFGAKKASHGLNHSLSFGKKRSSFLLFIRLIQPSI